jgi:hypothetical protein
MEQPILSEQEIQSYKQDPPGWSGIQRVLRSHEALRLELAQVREENQLIVKSFAALKVHVKERAEAFKRMEQERNEARAELAKCGPINKSAS